jgi:hypothetical protein
VCNKQVSGYAYRDGKGGATLGINTIICSHERDLVVCNPQDAERFRIPIGEQGSERVKWFREVCEEKTKNCDFGDLFLELNVQPLTLEQATPEWFLLWMFSCTSSSTDRLLVELKKVVSSTTSLIDPAIFSALHNVLTAVHGGGWNRRYELFYYIMF